MASDKILKGLLYLLIKYGQMLYSTRTRIY